MRSSVFSTGRAPSAELSLEGEIAAPSLAQVLLRYSTSIVFSLFPDVPEPPIVVVSWCTTKTTSASAPARSAMIESLRDDGAFGLYFVPWEAVLDEDIGQSISTIANRAAELTGHLPDREDWGCEGRASLACLEASGPDQRHPSRLGVPRPASRLAALTDCRRSGRGSPSRQRLNAS